MRVSEYDQGRFLVQSEADPGIHYMVELTDRKWPHGRCECDDFNIRIEFMVKQGTPPPRLTCKHIDAAVASVSLNRLLCEQAGIEVQWVTDVGFRRTTEGVLPYIQ